jgi:hypothetical protein
MLITIFFIISIGAFIFSQIARGKSESILVSYNITVSEELIAELGLYTGLAVTLRCAEEKDMISVWVTNAAGCEVLLGNFSSYIEYDILKRKNINAFIYTITRNIVSIEVKLREAL